MEEPARKIRFGAAEVELDFNDLKDAQASVIAAIKHFADDGTTGRIEEAWVEARRKWQEGTSMESNFSEHVDEFDEIEADERAALAAIFERAQELHLRKRQDYSAGGKDVGDDLGAAGQYAEIHRKSAKLRRCLWQGLPMIGEQPVEILLDLMGHAAKAVRYLETENMR